MPPLDPEGGIRSEDGDPDLDAAIAQVLRAIEANDSARIAAIIRRHPDKESAIRRFLATHGVVERLLAPLREGLVAAADLAAACVPSLESGRRLGDFELLRELARGGMGVVYLARQVHLDRLVALKTIQAGAAGADREQIERFRREAAAAARLHHPHIVSVFGAGQADGIHYLAMEYVEGQSLASRIKDHPFGLAAAVEIVRKVAEAVDVAHSAGIVHRDLKPSNILLDTGGEPKVGDFGLATFPAEGSDLTMTGALVGTPSYMAPEQATRSRDQVGPATDVHALGVLLYELLVDRPPYRGETPLDTMGRIANDEPIPPRRVRPEIPRDLETICLKCLEKNPKRRYPTARALADELRRFQRNEPILARPAGPWTRMLKWVRRRPAAAGLLVASAAFLVTVVALLVVSLQSLERSRADEQRLVGANRQLQRALDTVRLEAQKSRSRLYGQDMREAFDAAAKGQTDLVHQRLANWSSPGAEPDDDPRGIEWHFLANSSPRSASVLDEKAGPVMDIECAPGGQSVAAGCADGTIRVWTLANGKKPANWRAHDGGVDDLEYLSDTDLVSVGRDGARIWSVTGALTRALPFPIAADACLAVAPGGTRIALGQGHQVTIAHLPEGTLEAALPIAGNVDDVAFSPDGTLLAAGANQDGKDGVVEIWQPSPPKRIAVLRGQGGPINDVVFSRDSATIATAGGDGRIRLWDRSGRHRTTLEGHTDKIYTLVFSPVDDRLVSCGRDQTIRVWDTSSLAIEQEGAIGAIGLSADARWLACSLAEDKTVRVWNVDQKEPLTSLTVTSPIQSLAFSPEGDVLTLAGDGLELWDKATARRTRLPEGDGRRFRAVVLGPNGKYVLAADIEGRATLWWPGTPRPPRELNIENQEIGPLALTGAGIGATGSNTEARVDVWDLEQGEPLRRIVSDDVPRGVAFSTDGTRLAIGTAMGWIQVVDWQAESTVARWQAHPADITQLTFVDNDTRVLSADAEGRIRRWDSASGRALPFPSADPEVGPILVLTGERFAWAEGRTAWISHADRWRPGATLRAHAGRVWSVALSPEGQRAYSTGADETVRTWNLDSAAGRPKTIELPQDVACLAGSVDGTEIITGGAGGVAAVWRLPEGRETRILSIQPTKIRAARLAPNGILAAIAEGNDVALYDVRRMRAVLRLSGHVKEVCGLEFAPDGSRIATASNDGTVRIWNTTNGKEETVLAADPLGVESVAFSPDGLSLASAGHGGDVLLWNRLSSSLVRRLKGHGQTVRALAFSPDGLRLASGGHDRTARLWELEGNGVTVLRHESSVLALSFAPDGKTLLTETERAETTFWQVPFGEKMGVFGTSGTLDIGPFFGEHNRSLYLPSLGRPNRERFRLQPHPLVPRGVAPLAEQRETPLAATLERGEKPLVVQAGQAVDLPTGAILESPAAFVRGRLSARGPGTGWVNHGRLRLEQGEIVIQDGTVVTDHGWTIGSGASETAPIKVEIQGLGSRWLTDAAARVTGTAPVELVVADGAELRIAQSLAIEQQVAFRGTITGPAAYLQVNHFPLLWSGAIDISGGARAYFGGLRIGHPRRPTATGAQVQVGGSGTILKVGGDVTAGTSADDPAAVAATAADRPAHLLTIHDKATLEASGAISIARSGVLNLDGGSVHAARLEIRSGLASCRGIIKASVDNQGTLTIGPAAPNPDRDALPRGLVIEGELVQGAMGVIKIRAPAEGSEPILLVRGRAELHGRLVWQPAAPAAPAAAPDHPPGSANLRDKVVLVRADSIDGDMTLEPATSAHGSWRLEKTRTEIVARRDLRP